MRVITGGGLMTIALLAIPPSAARAEWCAQYHSGGTNCGFGTHAQCQAAISGLGGWCVQTGEAEARPAAPATRRARTPAKPKTKAAARPSKPPSAAPAPAPAPAQPAAIPEPAARPKPVALAAPPDSGAFAAARKLILDGQYETGLTAMQKLGANDHPDVASFIGLAHRKLGRNDEARAWYDKALAANPRHLQTLAFYGVLRVELGDLAGARLDLQKIRLICGNTSCNEYVGLAGVIAAKAR